MSEEETIKQLETATGHRKSDLLRHLKRLYRAKEQNGQD